MYLWIAFALSLDGGCNILSRGEYELNFRRGSSILPHPGRLLFGCSVCSMSVGIMNDGFGGS